MCDFNGWVVSSDQGSSLTLIVFKKDQESLILCYGFGLTFEGHLQDLSECGISGHHVVTYLCLVSERT